MNLQYRRLTLDSLDVSKTQALYEGAFPPEERPSFEMALSFTKCQFLEVKDEDEFVGLVDLIPMEKAVYIFFLAVEEVKRKKGYGSKILADVVQQNEGKTIFLLADEADRKYPDYESRLRRLDFYQHNGFMVSKTLICEYGCTYSLLSYKGMPATSLLFYEAMHYILDDSLWESYQANTCVVAE